MNTPYWIISFIIILVNIADLHCAPFGEFYFPDKFEKVKQYHPTKLNRQFFDHDYHIDDHRRFNNQQSDRTVDDNDNSDETPQNDGHHDDRNNNGNDDTNGGDNDNDFDSQSDNNSNGPLDNNGQFDNGGNNNGHVDTSGHNNGQFDTNGHNNEHFDMNGNVDNNFDWKNGNNNNNGFPRDFPAISNTVCETRCNTDVTPQYNPICGTDGLTYYNSGRMNCAQICGKSVKFIRMGSCSSALISN